MNALEARTCAACGEVRPTMRSRANHERIHRGWEPSPDLRLARRTFKNHAWKASQGPAYNWISHANRTAAKYGLPPLSQRTELPDGPCTYCGGPADGWDHVVPFSRGGSHLVENLTPACHPCNQRKNRYSADVFAMPSSMTLLCGWCWSPVVRSAKEVRDVRYVACSLRCQGKVAAYLRHYPERAA